MLASALAAKKAELINYGKIHIPKELTLPFYPSRSTAGPGAGKSAMVFGFGGTRVKLSIVRDGSAIYSLAMKPKTGESSCISGSPYMILKNDEPFLDEVSLEPTLMHAPCQAFINITSDCIYDCSFCVTPELDKNRKQCSADRWLELILAHAKNPSLQAVAITSGVAESPHNTILDMVKIIKGVREKLPEIPIGVEPYTTEKEDIDLLHSAGATEIKINLESPVREIFNKVCPDLDYDGIYEVLKYAVSVFGRNRVCSNLIVGLGESDEDIMRSVEDLASIGVVASLRAIRLNEINIPKLTSALGYTPEPVPSTRLLALAEKQKRALEKYNLYTTEFKTMCHRCKSCDIVPQQDL